MPAKHQVRGSLQSARAILHGSCESNPLNGFQHFVEGGGEGRVWRRKHVHGLCMSVRTSVYVMFETTYGRSQPASSRSMNRVI
jgi:hypothetical protein